MDLSSLSLGEKIVAVSGAALFIFMFPSWLQDNSAWELFSVVSYLLAILAITAVAFPVAKAFGYEQQLRPSDRAILVRVGTVALVLILAYFLEALANAQWGLWLSVLAAAGIFYGAVTMPSDEASRRGTRDRTRRPRSDRDFEEPPPGMESWRAGSDEGQDAESAPATTERSASLEDEGGPASDSPRALRGEERPRRASAFEEIEFDPEPERTETRRRRPPPEDPPTTER